MVDKQTKAWAAGRGGWGTLLWKPHLPFTHGDQLEGQQRGSGDQRQFLQSTVTPSMVFPTRASPTMAALSTTAACLCTAQGTRAGEPSPDMGVGGDKYKTHPLASMLKYSPQNKADRRDTISGLMTPRFLATVLQEQDDNISGCSGCKI